MFPAIRVIGSVGHGGFCDVQEMHDLIPYDQQPPYGLLCIMRDPDVRNVRPTDEQRLAAAVEWRSRVERGLIKPAEEWEQSANKLAADTLGEFWLIKESPYVEGEEPFPVMTKQRGMLADQLDRAVACLLIYREIGDYVISPQLQKAAAREWRKRFPNGAASVSCRDWQRGADTVVRTLLSKPETVTA